MNNKLILLLFLVTIFSFCQAQQSNLIEIIEERDMFSNTYLNSQGGKEKILAGEPLHYKNKGLWKSISTQLLKDNNHYINETNIIKSKFPSKYGSEDILLSYNNEEIKIKSKKKIVTYSSSHGLNSFLVGLDNSIITNVNKNKIEYSNLTYTDKYIIKNGQVKNELLLNHSLSGIISNNAEYFGFEEEIELPKGWRIETNKNLTLTNDGIKIFNTNGEHVLSIPAPVYFDNSTFSSDGSNLNVGSFLVSEINGKWLITTLVPTSWLNSSNRSFPITIDPTVTLAGIDGGWQSQNNYVNNPNFVFIGVCCGNLEHRAWIKFNTASIPDASCVTDVQLQVFVNGVGSATAELVHAYDMTGAFGPYGGISPAVYTDMGDGYYTSFTITGAATYGYYDLGPNADALLQNQLPGDLYQVSLIFDNEPSTNWKRITATSCNLRVSYDNPPCATLPVELIEFSAECKNENTELTWVTASEIENDRFEIQKLNNLGIFNTIGNVVGSGSSSTTNYYSFIDEDRNQETEYYRLKQVDYNGEEKIHNIISSNCTGKVDVIRSTLTKNSMGITLYSNSNNLIKIDLIDISGKIVLREEYLIEKGENFIQFDNLQTKAGMYFLSIKNDLINTTHKLVVSN